MSDHQFRRDFRQGGAADGEEGRQLLDNLREEQTALLDRTYVAEFPGLLPNAEQIHDGIGLADGHHKAVGDVVGIGFHPISAPQHFDQSPGLLRTMVVGFQFDRSQERFDCFWLFANPGQNNPEVEPCRGIVRRELRQFLERLARIAELAGGKAG
jgi:hypothetical protein